VQNQNGSQSLEGSAFVHRKGEVHMQLVSIAMFCMLATMVSLSACMQSAPAGGQAATTSGEQRVFFVEPRHEEEVSNPVTLKFGAENFIVEATGGEIKPGHGHLHVMVDTDCIVAGQGIPQDETHLHFGKGQMETQVELPSGEHTLCLQAADGNHIALEGAGMTDQITVVVP
jgi:hypothetical protein